MFLNFQIVKELEILVSCFCRLKKILKLGAIALGNTHLKIVIKVQDDPSELSLHA